MGELFYCITKVDTMCPVLFPGNTIWIKQQFFPTLYIQVCYQFCHVQRWPPSSVHAEFLIHKVIELFAVHLHFMKVLRWFVTEPKNQDLSCPLRHHPDDLLRPDLVQLLQEAQPHQVRRILSQKENIFKLLAQVFGCPLRRGWRGL